MIDPALTSLPRNGNAEVNSLNCPMANWGETTNHSSCTFGQLSHHYSHRTATNTSPAGETCSNRENDWHGASPAAILAVIRIKIVHVARSACMASRSPLVIGGTTECTRPSNRGPHYSVRKTNPDTALGSHRLFVAFVRQGLAQLAAIGRC